MDGQGTKWRRNSAENFNRLSRVHEQHIANVNVAKNQRILMQFSLLDFKRNDSALQNVRVVSYAVVYPGFHMNFTYLN